MAKITRKSYQRKKIIMGVTLFGAVGLVSTGFAAWVLSAGAQTQQQATLNAGTVDNTNMKFSTPLIYKTGDSLKASVNTFAFQPKLSDNSGRVKAKVGDPDELLSLTVETTLTNCQNLGRLYLRTAVTEKEGSYTKVDENDPNSETWTTNLEEAAAKGYIVLPESIDTDIELYGRTAEQDIDQATIRDEFTIDSTHDYLGTLVYEFKFEWGAFFGGMNPCLFFDSATAAVNVDGSPYDGQKGREIADDDVEDILVELHDLLDTAVLDMTIYAESV